MKQKLQIWQTIKTVFGIIFCLIGLYIAAKLMWEAPIGMPNGQVIIHGTAK